jgi:hypothetical protein
MIAEQSCAGFPRRTQAPPARGRKHPEIAVLVWPSASRSPISCLLPKEAERAKPGPVNSRRCSSDAYLLSAGVQGNDAVVWALADPQVQEWTTQRIHIVGTGHPIGVVGRLAELVGRESDELLEGGGPQQLSHSHQMMVIVLSDESHQVKDSHWLVETRMLGRPGGPFVVQGFEALDEPTPGLPEGCQKRSRLCLVVVRLLGAAVRHVGRSQRLEACVVVVEAKEPKALSLGEMADVLQYGPGISGSHPKDVGTQGLDAVGDAGRCAPEPLQDVREHGDRQVEGEATLNPRGSLWHVRLLSQMAVSLTAVRSWVGSRLLRAPTVARCASCREAPRGRARVRDAPSARMTTCRSRCSFSISLSRELHFLVIVDTLRAVIAYRPSAIRSAHGQTLVRPTI